MRESEKQFLDYVKSAEATPTNEDDSAKGKIEVYSDVSSSIEQPDVVEFSDTAQESSKDVREGVASRLLDLQRERGVIGNILPQGETSSIQLKPVEKVSSRHAPTLMEQTLGLLGRV